MKRSRLLIFTLILFVVFAFSAFAAEYDGYMFSFKTPEAEQTYFDMIRSEVSLFSGESELKEIGNDMGIYKSYNLEIIEELERLGLVENVEPDYECYLYDYTYTAEPKYTNQWAHEATNVEYAWNLGIYGNDVNVAVLDSGFLDTHEDFTQSNILPGYNYTITNTADLSIDSSDYSPDSFSMSYHGTAVASVVASSVNSKGCVGVAHRANIIPIKVYGNVKSGTSYVEGCWTSDVINAINKAAELGADIINLSLGFNSYSSNMKNAIDYVQMFDVIVIASAGNLTSSQPPNTDENGNYNYSYPAAYDNVISVANVQKTAAGAYTWSSSSRYNDKVDIAAPGTSIYAATISSNSSYGYVSGTSFASPYIAGVAALAKSVMPDLNQSEFRELLISTADKSYLAQDETRNDKYGYGLVDVEALIKKLIGNTAEGFISPVDRKDDGKITVKINNRLASSRAVTLMTKTENNHKKPLGIKLNPITLAGNGVAEFEISGLLNSATSEIYCYLLDSLTLRPLYQKTNG